MQTQTDWLIVDMRNHVWECAERVLQRKLDSGEYAEVTWGVWFDSKTRHSGPIESQMYVPVNNEYVSLTCPLEQVSGILHVLGSILVLTTHEDVHLTPCRVRTRLGSFCLKAAP